MSEKCGMKYELLMTIVGSACLNHSNLHFVSEKRSMKYELLMTIVSSACLKHSNFPEYVFSS